MDETSRQSGGGQNWRVKVYLLNELGNWDDCGTGLLEFTREIKTDEEIDLIKVNSHEAPPNNDNNISVENRAKLKGGSESPAVILNLPINKENQYDKQGGRKFSIF